MQRQGIIVVDHGSRRAASNEWLDLVVSQFRAASENGIVEPAHMELAEPTIGQAYDRCVDQGANLVVVSPFFLLDGRHWTEHLPELSAAAQRRHPQTDFIVAAPIGAHPLLAKVMLSRIERCTARQHDASLTCEFCTDASGCLQHRL